MKGDCYKVSAKYVLDRPNEDGLKLVHGDVFHPVDRYYHGHAWVEKNDIVIEKSNGLNTTVPKELYYKLGKIKNTISYNYNNVISNILKFKHWGSW